MYPTKNKTELARMAHNERLAKDLAEPEHGCQCGAVATAAVGPCDIDLGTVAERLQTIRAFQQLVRSQLVQDHDFGVIPGTGKPTLLKPGAEKIAKLLGLADGYEICEKIEDWSRGFFAYTVRCRLTNINTGVLVSEGLGSCNSKESRYAWRWCFASEVPSDVDRRHLKTKEIRTKRGPATMYRVPNDDIFSQVNTILKMSKKRAMVDAALSAGRLSDLFTQDMEDTRQPGGGHEEPEAEPGEPVDTERAAILQKIQDILVERYAADDKEAKALALKEHFGQRSWRSVSAMPLDILRKGLAALQDGQLPEPARQGSTPVTLPGSSKGGERDEFDLFIEGD